MDHLAGVYDAAAQSASLYVNGVLADTVYNVVAGPATGPTAIGRGKFAGNPVDFVNRAVDDVRLYQAALAPPEVLAIARVGDPTLRGQLPVEPATLAIDAANPGHEVSPILHGLMIEEINHSLDGGLYAELVQNRVFKDDPAVPVHWSLVQDKGASGSIALDTTQPIAGTALTTSLRVTAGDPAAVGSEPPMTATAGYRSGRTRPTAPPCSRRATLAGPDRSP